MNNTLQVIPLSKLAPSPLNPRKTFDPVKLQELADSIASKGIIEPLVVRPHQNGGPAMFEIVAGERRYRASELAQVGEVPCIIRELDDVEVLEIMTIENSQRDDVHPLEEAEGYAALMKAAGYDVEHIAGKIGRSTKYVYDRIKLLQLIPAARKVFVEGEISAGHAILLARLSTADQERIIDPDDMGNAYQLRGLWQMDMGDPDLDLDDDRRRKPISVRELGHYIDDHVRLRPEEVDLPNLFPETAAALEVAKEEELKVVKITRSYRVTDQARDEKERTYGSASWKRADGVPDEDRYGKERKSKTCDHSVMGVVVAGFGRGEAFRVCVAKKKCKVHWAAEMKAADERGAPNGAGTKKGKAAAQETWQQQDARRREQEKVAQAERARWKKAAPKLLEVLVEKVGSAPIEDMLDIVLEQCLRGRKPKQMERGKTVETAIRYGAFAMLSRNFDNEYWIEKDATSALKGFGVNARKIVDEVAPKPAPEKKPKAKAAPKKKGARARRREKKGAVQTSARGAA